MLQPVGIFAVTAVGGTPARLHVSAAPGLGTDSANEGRRMEGTGADLHVQGLHDQAALRGPVTLQGLDQPLETVDVDGRRIAHLFSKSKAGDYNQLRFVTDTFSSRLCCRLIRL